MKTLLVLELSLSVQFYSALVKKICFCKSWVTVNMATAVAPERVVSKLPIQTVIGDAEIWVQGIYHCINR